jgi:hypothetical protein
VARVLSALAVTPTQAGDAAHAVTAVWHLCDSHRYTQRPSIAGREGSAAADGEKEKKAQPWLMPTASAARPRSTRTLLAPSPANTQPSTLAIKNNENQHTGFIPVCTGQRTRRLARSVFAHSTSPNRAQLS